MKAVILAAGKGTRLLPYSNVFPKALMPIDLNEDGSFMSIIEKLIHQIINAGISEIFIVVNYRQELIKDYLGNGERYNARFEYVFQDILDGNGGAFYRCQDKIGDEDVLIADCDNYLSKDSFISNLKLKHESNKTDLTIAVSRVKNIAKYAIIKVDENLNPLDIYEKPVDEKQWGNVAKTGVMILSNKLANLDKSIAKIESSTTKENYTTTQIVKYCLMHSDLFKTQICFVDGFFHDTGTWNEYLPILRKNLEKKNI